MCVRVHLPGFCCNRSNLLLLGELWLTNVKEEAGVGCAAGGEVLPGVIEAELAVDGEPHLGGIFILLTIVFPLANRAQVKDAGRYKSLVPAAWATKLDGDHMGADHGDPSCIWMDGKRESQDYNRVK
jgi:hypothetical protein